MEHGIRAVRATDVNQRGHEYVELGNVLSRVSAEPAAPPAPVVDNPAVVTAPTAAPPAAAAAAPAAKEKKPKRRVRLLSTVDVIK